MQRMSRIKLKAASIRQVWTSIKGILTKQQKQPKYKTSLRNSQREGRDSTIRSISIKSLAEPKNLIIIWTDSLKYKIRKIENLFDNSAQLFTKAPSKEYRLPSKLKKHNLELQ